MQQRSGSDLSRAGSSIPAPRSGLQRTVSSVAASGKAGSEKGRIGSFASAAADEPASKLRRSVSGTAVLPCDTAQLQQRPSSTEDLRRSVESTGLKVHAARSAGLGAAFRPASPAAGRFCKRSCPGRLFATRHMHWCSAKVMQECRLLTALPSAGTAGRNWPARPPTAPNPVHVRLGGGHGGLHQQCSSLSETTLAAPSIRQAGRTCASSAQQSVCTCLHCFAMLHLPGLLPSDTFMLLMDASAIAATFLPHALRFCLLPSKPITQLYVEARTRVFTRLATSSACSC